MVMLNAIMAQSHRGSTGPAEPLRTTATTYMAAANFVVITKDVREAASCYYAGDTNVMQLVLNWPWL